MGVEIAYGSTQTNLKFKNKSTFIGSNYRSWEIKPQIIFLLNSQARTPKYISGELFYIHHQDHFITNANTKSKLLIYRDFVHRQYEEADYQRLKYGLNIKFGILLPVSKRMGFNISAGPGLRIRDVRYSNVIGASIYEERKDTLFITVGSRGYISEIGKNWRMHFSLDAKLYYKIFK